MAWYRIALRPEDISSGRHYTLCEQFNSLFTLAGNPLNAVMNADTNVMTNVYYFSPAAAVIVISLIRNYGGEECSMPDRSSVRMVAGNADAADIPFRKA